MVRFLKTLIGLLIASIITSVATTSTAALRPGIKGVVILVPGTWNSLIPGDSRVNPINNVLENNPYFGSTVLDTVIKQNYDYYVIKNLNPMGDVYANAHETGRQILAWYEQNVPKHDMPITILGHSMGGVYALAVLNSLSSLPIKNVVLISTPLDGAPAADDFLSNAFSKMAINTMYNLAGSLFDFRGLEQASTSEMRTFLKNAVIPADKNYFAVGSSQPIPPTIFQMFQSQYLNPLFAFLALFRSEATDGLVPVRSATVSLPHQRTRVLPFVGHLDHAEQVLDYRILALTGTTNIKYVREQQAQFYRQILSSLP